MNNKLYVGGISYNTTEEGLRTAFASAGTVVSVTIIIDKYSGRSKGFGFIEMSTDEEAQKAIALWNEKELDGRKLVVNIARPLEERPPRRDFAPRQGFRSGGFGGGGGNRSGGFRGGGGREFHGMRRGSR